MIVTFKSMSPYLVSDYQYIPSTTSQGTMYSDGMPILDRLERALDRKHG